MSEWFLFLALSDQSNLVDYEQLGERLKRSGIEPVVLSRGSPGGCTYLER